MIRILRRLAYSQNNDIARPARIPLEPRPVFLLHSHWNTDLGDKLLQIVGQPIINHCNFPGKTSHLHLMRRNVGGQLLILLRCLGMAAPEANPNTQCLRQLLHLPIIVVLLIQHQKDTVAGGIFPLLQVFPRKADSYFFQENRRPQPAQCRPWLPLQAPRS